MLAQSLSLQVGWYATDTTKHVWASFPIPLIPQVRIRRHQWPIPGSSI